MLTLQTNTVTADKPVIVASGVATLSEYITRDSYNVVSYAQVNFAGTSISGLIDTLSLSLYTDVQPATDILTFNSVPTAYSTVTVSGINYTFIPIASGFTAVNQVHLGNTAFETALNFHRVFNVLGVSGIDYRTGQTAHATAISSYASESLILLARTPGTGGNYITLSASDTNAITVSSSRFYNGLSATPTITTPYILGVSGIITGNYWLGPVSYTDIGYPQAGTLTLLGSGITAVNANGVIAVYTLSGTKFYGRTSLTEFAEVSGLQSPNLYNGKVGSDGLLMLTWSGMSYYQVGGTLPLDSPNISGLPTQNTRAYADAELAHAPEYCVFIYTGNSAPQKTWPRTTDANGTWYFAGHTNKPRAIVKTPHPSTYIGAWVGYGNKGTWDTTVCPFRSYSSSVYLT